MAPETLALIATYLMCSEAAEVRVLERSEMEGCTAVYMRVKMSFVPDFRIEDYEKATATERAALNRQGYAGFLAWQASNPELVQEMEADARKFAKGLANQSVSR